MNFVIGILIFVGGYVASIYSWPKLKELANGVETEVRALEDKIRALRAKV